MTPIYNQYIIKNRNDKGILMDYKSEIAFIDKNKPFISSVLYYVTFCGELKDKTGFYLDNNNYLQKLLNFKLLKDISFLEQTSGIIEDIKKVNRHHSYIKVIKDNQNPQLEGQIMLFYFSRIIFDKIAHFILENSKIDKTFIIDVESLSFGSQLYPSYQNSHFTDNEAESIYLNMDIESELIYKTINVSSIIRKKKLDKMNLDRQERYELYMELKKEFENE